MDRAQSRQPQEEPVSSRVGRGLLSGEVRGLGGDLASAGSSSGEDFALHPYSH